MNQPTVLVTQLNNGQIRVSFNNESVELLGLQPAERQYDTHLGPLLSPSVALMPIMKDYVIRTYEDGSKFIGSYVDHFEIHNKMVFRTSYYNFQGRVHQKARVADMNVSGGALCCGYEKRDLKSFKGILKPMDVENRFMVEITEVQFKGAEKRVPVSELQYVENV